jgi:hypothetical protein
VSAGLMVKNPGENWTDQLTILAVFIDRVVVEIFKGQKFVVFSDGDWWCLESEGSGEAKLSVSALKFAAGFSNFVRFQIIKSPRESSSNPSSIDSSDTKLSRNPLNIQIAF